MPLEDIIAKVKDDKTQKIEELKSSHREEMEEIKNKMEKDLGRLQKELKEEREEKESELLKEKKKEKEFELEMERLELKKELLGKAVEKATEKIANKDPKERKRVYLDRLRKAKDSLAGDDFSIKVPTDKKKKLKPLLDQVGFEKTPAEENLGFKEGFLFEGKNWELKITLEEIIREIVEKNKGEYVNLLF